MSLDVIQSNNYTIVSEGRIATILSQFDKNIVYSIIQDIINTRSSYYNYNMPTNIPASYESNFKQMMIDFPSEKETIDIKRYNIYNDIINILCNSHGLCFNGQAMQDLYSAAFHLYNLLISNFNNNIISFFINYIIREKNNLYDGLRLNDYKKNKDTSTAYNKKMYKNTKLAIIAANLEYVIDNICVFDISFDVLLNYIYIDKNISRFILSIVSPMCDFYKTMFTPLIGDNSGIRAILISAIRIELQKVAMDEDISIENI